jgi:putative drug exporter of the RND superfamily
MIARLTRVLYACGRACVRFRWPVIAAWIAVAVVLHLAAASAGEDWTDNLTLPGTGSTRATDLLQERLPQQAYGSIPISLRDPNGTIGDSASKDAIPEIPQIMAETGVTSEPEVTFWHEVDTVDKF